MAAAFGAPIGGLLFAYEELASFFSQALGWQVFFACMLSVLTEDTLRSAQTAVTQGHFGLFDGEASTIFFEVRSMIQLTNVAPWPPAVTQRYKSSSRLPLACCHRHCPAVSVSIHFQWSAWMQGECPDGQMNLCWLETHIVAADVQIVCSFCRAYLHSLGL